MADSLNVNTPLHSHVPRYIILHKKRGETPLETIQAWKKENPHYASLPVTYAGRLDPMAEGTLLILLGDECKRKDAYIGLDKEYVVEVLLGVGTDTGDVLGIPTVGMGNEISLVTMEAARSAARSLVGAVTLPYPAFSSKPVNGKPLFTYALAGTLDTISIPTHTERIYRIRVESIKTLSNIELQQRIVSDLSLVPISNAPSKMLGADFRQHIIRDAWSDLFEAPSRDIKHAHDNRQWQIVTLRVTCASGTYMRTLAERFGACFDTRALALSINRTKIGTFVALGTFGVWGLQYKK